MSRCIALDEILIEGRLREIDEDHAQAIAQSMRDRDSLQPEQPIFVRSTNAAKRPFTLVDGGHRIRAVEILGGTEIVAEIKAYNKDEARLVEIDTGLIRADLTALDRALALAERKIIYERLHPETKHGGDRRSADAQNQEDKIVHLKFTADAAERIGIGEKDIQRSIFIASHLTKPDIKALRGTPEAKNASRLLKLARMEPEKRQVAMNLFREKVPLGDAISQAEGGKPKQPDHEKKFDQLVSAWSLAPKRARLKWLALVKDEIAALMEEA